MRKGIPALLLTLSLLLCGCRLLPERIPPAGLTVHFLDVGQADCALLESGGEYMLIDGGNREDGQLVVSYLEQQGVEELAAVVCTHAHEDHVGGLPSVLAVYPTHAVYAPTRTYASKVFDDFVYYADQQRLEITIPSPGDSWTLGETSVTVLGPVQSYADPNDTSIILRVEYGDTSFLFTGDMETTAENDMLDYWGSRMSWGTDVLNRSHDFSRQISFLSVLCSIMGMCSFGCCIEGDGEGGKRGTGGENPEGEGGLQPGCPPFPGLSPQASGRTVLRDPSTQTMKKTPGKDGHER